MPSITDAINEKYGVHGATIADAYAQVAGYEPGQGPNNIADALALAKDRYDQAMTESQTETTPAQEEQL